MNFVSTFLLAFAMSTDAFAAAIGKGAALYKPHWREALRTGLIFGTIEAVTPIVGWLAGHAASRHVEQWDHWIAFALLGGLGLRMLWLGLVAQPEAEDDKPSSNGFWALALTGLGTSIDAMAVGVGLAFGAVNIWVTAAAIGLMTATMVTLGVLLGRLLGGALGRRAEALGGAILIGIGGFILFEHLHAA